MAGKLINNTITSLASGVSQQYQAGRFDSQVEEMVNCMPNITRGVIRRNPLVAVSDLSATNLDGSFVYTYDRGTGDEQYLLIARGDGSLEVFNVNSGVSIYKKENDPYLVAPVGTLAKDVFKALTIGDHTFVLNTTITTTFTEDITTNKGLSDMAFYWIKRTTSVVVEQYQTGSDPITSGSLTKGYDYTLNNLKVSAYTESRPGQVAVELNTSFNIAEEFVGEAAITPTIPNMESNTTPSGVASASSDNSNAYIGLSDNTYSVGFIRYSTWTSTSSLGWLAYESVAPITVRTFSLQEYTTDNYFTTNTPSNPVDFEIQGSDDGATWVTLASYVGITSWKAGLTKVFEIENTTAYLHHRINILKVQNNLKAAVKGLQLSEQSPTYTQLSQATHISKDSTDTVDSAICYALTEPTKWDWEDSFGNQASRGVWQTVPDSDELPANLPEDLDQFKVKVNGSTASDADDYFLLYDYPSKSWKESTAPSIAYKLDGTTMPHALYRLADGTFLFDSYKLINSDGLTLGDSAWADRIIGGADLGIEDPSFIGSTLNNIFFYKNRLGLMTDSNIILSRTGDYSNFFLKTLQDVLDDDPIDLAIAGTDVSILRDIVTIGGNLIIFSDESQFLLGSIGGVLTTKTAEITSLSRYTYSGKAPAVTVGNKVFFTSSATSYSQVFTYQVSDNGSQVTEATPRTLHLPTYLDKSLHSIKGHDVLGYTFFASDDIPKELVVFTSVIKGQEDLQAAFHKWTFELDILSIDIINNSLYILFTNGNLGSISLDIPGSIDDVVYIDAYTDIAPDVTLTNYESTIEFSQFYYRSGDGKGTERGRYQLRTMKHDVTSNSHYITKIHDTGYELLITDTDFGPTWIDTDVWDDTLTWVDVDPLYVREYPNDNKVTVMGDSQKIRIAFVSSEENPTKGFEIATTNIEGFFYQRSTRT